MTETTRPRPIRVTLVDESDLVIAGLATLLAPHDDLTLVPASPGGGPATFVDVTLHDTFARLPLSQRTLCRLATRPSGGRFVVYSWNVHSELVSTALANGASGVLSKWLPADELAEGLRAVAGGEQVVRTPPRAESDELTQARLTPRELEVVGLIAAGLSNLEIAATTSLSVNSIKSYIRGAYRKIEATSRSQAVLWAVRNGCVTTAPSRAAQADPDGPSTARRDGPAA